MTTNEPKVATWLAQLPETDKPGKESTLTGPAWDEARKVIAGILEGGRESLIELAGMVENGFGGGKHGYRPGYALRCIALHAGAPGNESAHKLFVEAVASRLGTSQPKEAQAFLVRELQLAGGTEAAAALGKLLGDEDLCGTAAQALVALGGSESSAVLLGAWSAAKGKCRLAIAQAFGSLRTAAAASPLREALGGALGDADRDLRLTAAWSLARLGDGASAEALLRLADGAMGWERGQATKACLLLAEALVAAGKKEEARKVYVHLQARQDPSESHVREAAERGLAAAS